MADWLQTPVYGPLFGAVVCLVMWVIFCLVFGLLWLSVREPRQRQEPPEGGRPSDAPANLLDHEVIAAALARAQRGQTRPLARVSIREVARDE